MVLDVGINRVVVCPACGTLNRSKKNPCKKCGADLAEAQSKTVGDVDFEAVSAKAGAITPVPGGVGAVTNMMLARNTLRAARLQLDEEVVIPPGGREVRQVDHLQEEALRRGPRGPRRRHEASSSSAAANAPRPPGPAASRKWPR